jgi:hypothetical protein
MEENIKTADNLGLATHLFKDSQSLYKYLVKTQILIAN